MLDDNSLSHYANGLAQLTEDLQRLSCTVGANFAVCSTTLSQLAQEVEGQSHEYYVKEFNHFLMQLTAHFYLDLLQLAQQHALAQVKADYPDLHPMPGGECIGQSTGATL